jgi:hypothetical protein
MPSKLRPSETENGHETTWGGSVQEKSRFQLNAPIKNQPQSIWSPSGTDPATTQKP